MIALALGDPKPGIAELTRIREGGKQGVRSKGRERGAKEGEEQGQGDQ